MTNSGTAQGPVTAAGRAMAAEGLDGLRHWYNHADRLAAVLAIEAEAWQAGCATTIIGEIKADEVAYDEWMKERGSTDPWMAFCAGRDSLRALAATSTTPPAGLDALNVISEALQDALPSGDPVMRQRQARAIERSFARQGVGLRAEQPKAEQ